MRDDHEPMELVMAGLLPREDRLKQTPIEGVLHPCPNGEEYHQFVFRALDDAGRQLMYWTGSTLGIEMYVRYKWWFTHCLPARTATVCMKLDGRETVLSVEEGGT